jgi:hypothetical protein
MMRLLSARIIGTSEEEPLSKLLLVMGFVGAVVVVLGMANLSQTRFQAASSAGSTTLDATKAAAVCPPLMPTPAPDPIWAHKVPIQTGKVDHPFPFTPGVIQIVHTPGCDLDALLRKYALGPAAPNITGPITDFDRAAGLDRSYRVQVAPGTEVATVVRLATHTAEFAFVGLFWIAPITLD